MEIVAILANINRDPRRIGPVSAAKLVPHIRIAPGAADASDVEAEYQRTPEELARDYTALTKALAGG